LGAQLLFVDLLLDPGRRPRQRRGRSRRHLISPTDPIEGPRTIGGASRIRCRESGGLSSPARPRRPLAGASAHCLRSLSPVFSSLTRRPPRPAPRSSCFGESDCMGLASPIALPDPREGRGPELPLTLDTE